MSEEYDVLGANKFPDKDQLRAIAKANAPGIRVSLEPDAGHGAWTIRLATYFGSVTSITERELSDPEIVEIRLRDAVDKFLEHVRVELRLTEKTVRLTAIIEKALGEARASSIPLGMTESLFYWQMLRRVESTLAEYRIETGGDHDGHEFCDPRLGCLLSEEPPASWIRKRDAEKWEEGRAAWAEYELALSDAEASGQGYRVSSPVNPYLVEEKNDDKDSSSTQ